MKHLSFVPLLLLVLSFAACGNEAPPMGAAVACRDSLPVMVTRGVSKLISDSGVVRYKIIAEEWRVYDKTTPPRWTFPQGILLERYNDKFDVNLHITADTAYLYDQNLWELRGRVVLNDREQGTQIHTDELFWDMRTGELHSNVYTRLRQPDRAIEGDRFRATVQNNQLTRYYVSQSKGFMPMSQSDGVGAEPTPKEAEQAKTDTAQTQEHKPLRDMPVATQKH